MYYVLGYNDDGEQMLLQCTEGKGVFELVPTPEMADMPSGEYDQDFKLIKRKPELDKPQAKDWSSPQWP